MKPEAKQRLTVIGAIAVIAVSCAWIYFSQVRAAQYNVALHERVGQVLAEQTAALIGKKGRVVAIAIDPKEWPELKTQLEAFRAGLKKLGEYELREHEMDTKDQPKYGVGSGLSGRRYVRTVKKNPKADVFVSFIGAPKLSEQEVAELGTRPKLIAEARSPDNVPSLFESHCLEVAVVSRFQFPAPGPIKPKTPEEWFIKRYQIINASNLAAIPKS